MRHFLVILSLLLLPLVSLSQGKDLNGAEALISSMSIEKKVGQMFIFGFTGTRFNQSLKKKLETLYPGSIIVFGRNIKTLKQIKKLNEQAQKIALKHTQLPLFIAVDQEGGKVLRIKTSPALPSARTLALTKDPALVRSAGYVTGQLLSLLGFNMNLAPVVDISAPNQSDFLGNRSFSDRKEIVASMSVAFARGLIDSNVLPTAKHFPGHGGVKTDSHLATPYKQVTLRDLVASDLAPYQGLLEGEVPFAIMASHISYPLIDKSRLPASFSKVLLQDVLRKKMNFPGIVLTDDIQMKGAKLEKLGVGARAVKAVLAGNDVIMVGWNYSVQKKAVDAVVKAVKKGTIPEWRINQSLRRIFQAKLKFFNRNKSRENLKAQLNRIAFSDIYNSIFDRVFTNQKPLLTRDNSPVDIYSFSYRFLQSFKDIHGGRPAKYKSLRKFSRWKQYRKKPSTIVYHLSGPLSAKILRTAPAEIKKNIIVVNSSSRTTLQNEDQFKKVINVYSYHPKLGSYTAKYLTKKPEIEYRGPAGYSEDSFEH